VTPSETSGIEGNSPETSHEVSNLISQFITLASNQPDYDPNEMKILKVRGAFLLPPREIRDALVDSYFKWIYPYLPVVNKRQFMKQYNDPKNPPPLLLLQSVLFAGARTCNHPAILDKENSTKMYCKQSFKRAKAIFDSNFEKDKVVIVQSLILFSAWWEGRQDIHSSWYWIGAATKIAQGIGMHRK
jgi:hypothetical protein